MRKVDVEAKPEIDLQRKINVEVTLHELLLLTAAQGKSTKSKVGNFSIEGLVIAEEIV